MNEKKNVWEVIVRVVIAALSAALTAITTTSWPVLKIKN